MKALLLIAIAAALGSAAPVEVIHLGDGREIKVLRANGGEPVDVLYRMHLRESRWQAYDVQIAGISLVPSYRSSFAKEVRKGGIKGLIKRMTELNDSRVKRNAAKSG